MEDVKASLNSLELKNRMSENSNEDLMLWLFKAEVENLVQAVVEEICYPSLGQGEANATIVTRKEIVKLISQDTNNMSLLIILLRLVQLRMSCGKL